MPSKKLTKLMTQRLNSKRRKPSKNQDKQETENLNHIEEARTEIERDFDRILFSTPVRRLADKTQVFPLDKNDSVRNRLTHSYEVLNLARSVGVSLCYCENSIFKDIRNANRDVPALLAAAGLVHDLGNPPFGHQGENAIQDWFKGMQKDICITDDPQNSKLYQDFLLFEGNAQGLRLVTRLQLLSDSYGLNLTYATLAAMMKYTTESNRLDEKIAAWKKHGFFASEQDIAQNVLTNVGLKMGQRHPFSYIMEACDDIAYSGFNTG